MGGLCVFTDGSACPNPGRGGWAAVLVSDGVASGEVSGCEGFTTNNRMELRAVLEGLGLVPWGVPVTVLSDSMLVVRTVNEWAPSWEARGWRRSSGPVENLDLVRPLVETLRLRPEVSVRWVRAHAGDRWNEYADRLARAAASGAADV